MKNVLLKNLGCILMLLASPFLLFAQEKAEKEKDLTVIDTRQFVINFFRDSRTCNVDIEVTYKNKNNKKDEKNYYIIISNDNTITDTIELVEPLNFDIFRKSFSQKVDTLCYNNLTVSKSSINEIFLWIYSVKDVGITVPLSGKLIINPKIMVNTNTKLDKEYEQRVDTIVISEATIKPISQKKDNLIQNFNREFGNDLSNIKNKIKIKTIYNNKSLDTLIKLDLILKTYKNKNYSVPVLLDSLKRYKNVYDESLYYRNRLYIYDQWNNLYYELKRINVFSDTLAIKNSIDKIENYIDSRKKYFNAENINYKKDSLSLTKINIVQDSKINKILLDLKTDSTFIKTLLVNHDYKIYEKIKKEADALHILLDKIDSIQTQLEKLHIFTVKKISLQFERGFLERIQVWVPNSEGRDIIFENTYAIGFSSVRNFRDFTSIILFARNSTKVDNSAPHIFLSDVFSNYDNLLQNYTRDYSPADTTINLENMPGNGAVIELRREKYINLFDSKFYTDLVGTSENSPNGLVQIEVSRRFNLNTHRWSWINRTNYGLFNSITLYGSYNKLEDKEKYLQLRNQNVILNGDIISPSYATNLDFRRYEDYSLGIEPNIFLFDSPDNKFTLYADFCARYGHTPLQDRIRSVQNGEVDIDSLVNTQGHSFSLYPRFSFELFAEKRLGFKLSYQYNYTWLFSNNQFKQVASYEKSNLATLPIERNARKSHMIEFFLKVETSSDMSGRLFLRGRFFMQHGDVNTFFSQIQLGYAYNLVFKK